MEAGNWYKKTGSGPVTLYFHVLDADDDRMRVEVVEYHAFLRRIRDTRIETRATRAFREELLAGDLAQLPRVSVPFLLTV